MSSYEPNMCTLSYMHSRKSIKHELCIMTSVDKNKTGVLTYIVHNGKKNVLHLKELWVSTHTAFPAVYLI